MTWRPIKGFNEINDLLKRVEEIESQCSSKLRLNENFNVGDDYLVHKMRLFEFYSTASALLDQLEEKRSENKIILEKIKLKDLIEKMRGEIESLKKVNNRVSHNFSISKIVRAELGKRNDELDIYTKELLQVVQYRYDKLFKNGPDIHGIQATPLNSFLLGSDNSSKREKRISSLTVAEKDKMKEWNQFNNNFDDNIREIGNSATRVAERAMQLTNEARSQNFNIEEIKVLTEFTTNDIIGVNRRVQEIIGTSNNTTFCCRITLVILVFISISIIVALIFKKLI